MKYCVKKGTFLLTSDIDGVSVAPGILLHMYVWWQRPIKAGTKALVGSDSIDTNGGCLALVAHFMALWKGTFIGVVNRKWNLKALADHLLSLLVDNNLTPFQNFWRDQFGQSGDLANYYLFSHSSMQIRTVPLDFSVQNPIQYFVEFVCDCIELKFRSSFCEAQAKVIIECERGLHTTKRADLCADDIKATYDLGEASRGFLLCIFYSVFQALAFQFRGN